MVASPIKNSTLSDWDDEFIFCGIAGGVEISLILPAAIFTVFILIMNQMLLQQ